MARENKSQDGKTHIMPKRSGDSRRPAANTDDMVTAVRQTMVGRLVIVEGPGKGAILNLYSGTNSIGRDANSNVVPLNFGDTAIHRREHAFISYANNTFELHDNGKPNPLTVNGQVLVGARAIKPSDMIVIGATTLRLDKA